MGVARTESRQELLAGASMTRPNEAVFDAADGCGYPPSGGSTTAVFRTCVQFSSPLRVAATPSAAAAAVLALVTAGTSGLPP